MATEKTPAGSPSDVDITIEVVPGRVRAALTRLLARRRFCVGLLALGVVGAAAAASIVALAFDTNRARRSQISHSQRPGDSYAVLARFGLRLNCPRLAIVSTGGTYARVDFATDAPCGTYGNHITLILHRVHGAWVREFEASSWTCPTSRLPQRVLGELKLCQVGRRASRH